MFEKLKEQYEAGFLAKQTLATWVKIEKMKSGRGITEEQYEQITGEKYGGKQ